MRPGADCLECHGNGGGGGEGGEDDARPWTVAGTVFDGTGAGASGVRGAAIVITDAGGWTITLHSNSAGNFYVADGLRFPLRVAVALNGVTKTMPGSVSYGGCNSCHGPGGGASGRLAVTP
jgi:mono/diheme cytochrome c family protein